MDQAFVAGMLHDTGKLVLACNFPEAYDQVLQAAQDKLQPVTTAEEANFGANHADVGGYLLGLWGLPAPVVEAIALHHQPSRSLHQDFSPLTAVHAADALVSERRAERPTLLGEFPARLKNETGPTELGAPTGVTEAGSEPDLCYLERLGLAAHLERWRAAQNATSQAA